MLTLESLATFFGWCTVLNLALYIFSTLALTSIHGFASRIMTKMFRISEADFSRMTFDYIGRWKLLTISLNLVPYIALKLMLAN